MNKPSKSLAIMQPTFLPWLGYLALIDRVDEFIFLDNVQFDKRSWQQRNQIKTPQGNIWLTVPVLTKKQENQDIKNIKILYEGNKNPLDKIKKSIEFNYKKAPYFSKYADSFFEILDQKPMYLVELNKNIIKFLCDEIGISYNIAHASDIPVSGYKAERLANICHYKGATEYISPLGSQDYLEQSDAFSNIDTKIQYHRYEHPTYSQLYNEFEPYMCALDLLLNEGDNSLEIIRRGLRI